MLDLADPLWWWALLQISAISMVSEGECLLCYVGVARVDGDMKHTYVATGVAIVWIELLQRLTVKIDD